MAQAEAPARTILQRMALLLVFVPAMAQGLSSDRNQPITIEADRATLNEKDGSSIYEGNVHLQQGTLNLRGNRMTVQIADDEIEEIVLTGQPASYRQRPDGRDTDQHAEAGRIEYHAADERLILLDNARVWQSGAEEFRSERIVYNIKKNTVSAGGSAGDRVRITLQPKQRPDKQQPAPATPPAADAVEAGTGP
jgi:lipopolysaccharide export system protein LptA